ncbi:hypothetical protein KJ966_26550 [bacterium]|nr:hypothetical protein [bacterium]
MNEIKLAQKYKIIVFIELFSAAAIVVYWAGYYGFSRLSNQSPAFYAAFPNAIPFPDLFLAVLMVFSGWQILEKRKIGKVFIVLNATIMITLGIIGADFSLDGGIRLISMVSMLRKGFVNLWCIVFGLYFLLKIREKAKESKTENPDLDSQ